MCVEKMRGEIDRINNMRHEYRLKNNSEEREGWGADTCVEENKKFEDS